MGEMRGADKILVGKPKGRPLGKPRRIWKYSVKTNLQEMGLGHGLDCLAHDTDRWPALVNAVMNLQVS
jgi:hypothetical protein